MRSLPVLAAGGIATPRALAAEGVAGIRSVEPARNIVQSLAEEAEQLLGRWGAVVADAPA